MSNNMLHKIFKWISGDSSATCGWKQETGLMKAAATRTLRDAAAVFLHARLAASGGPDLILMKSKVGVPLRSVRLPRSLAN